VPPPEQRWRPAAPGFYSVAGGADATGSSDSDDDAREEHWRASLGAAVVSRPMAAAALEELRRLPFRTEQLVRAAAP
jgi:hypothetical protein